MIDNTGGNGAGLKRRIHMAKTGKVLKVIYFRTLSHDNNGREAAPSLSQIGEWATCEVMMDGKYLMTIIGKCSERAGI